jgi:hypothetical protein
MAACGAELTVHLVANWEVCTMLEAGEAAVAAVMGDEDHLCENSLTGLISTLCFLGLNDCTVAYQS